jgi:hypothetical protein
MKSGRGGRLVRDSRSQSELLGVVLVLGLVLLATVAVVALGSSAIADTQRRSELQSAEQAMTVFDSRAATVALGRSNARTVDFGESAGSYDVEPNGGRLVVVHEDWDGAGGTHELYNQPLGTVVYRNGDSEVAYQGGGVWAAEGGGSRMVSPPEFHYRAGTLTLPIVRVSGSGSASGQAVASVTESRRAHPVYSDPAASYPDGRTYVNPIENGEVTVRVQSRYYQAWADYFRDRTEGVVQVDDATQTASVTLVTLGTNGRFPMPGEGGSVDVRGLASHSLSDFEVTLRPDKTDSANFANLKWSLYVEEGSEQFELHLRQSGGSGCTADVSVTLYYSDDGGATHESWYDDDAFGTSCADLDGDGDDEVLLDANLNDPTVSLGYTDVSQSDLLHYKPSGTHVDPVVFDQHGVDDGTYATGDQLPLDTLVSHYFARLGPTFALTVDDKNADTVSEDVSEGYIVYTGNDDYVTYLHVTENEIVVVFED